MNYILYLYNLINRKGESIMKKMYLVSNNEIYMEMSPFGDKEKAKREYDETQQVFNAWLKRKEYS